MPSVQLVPNQNPSTEEIIAQINGAREFGLGKGASYDLYLTASRLVAIRMGGAAVIGGAAFGVAGR
ncbi:MAG: hypothetical protein M1587_05845 [Thaumarchaeota archaeon]|nr:hypothetical protein [Nitrososphaerota archaeon]